MKMTNIDDMLHLYAFISIQSRSEDHDLRACQFPLPIKITYDAISCQRRRGNAGALFRNVTCPERKKLDRLASPTLAVPPLVRLPCAPARLNFLPHALMQSQPSFQAISFS